METRRQGEALFSFILLLVGTVVVVQLWLVAASMEALLAHDFDVLLPAAAGSLGCFLLNAALLLYVFDFDRRLRRVSPRQE
jgi:hypothetical protein